MGHTSCKGLQQANQPLQQADDEPQQAGRSRRSPGRQASCRHAQALLGWQPTGRPCHAPGRLLQEPQVLAAAHRLVQRGNDERHAPHCTMHGGQHTNGCCVSHAMSWGAAARQRPAACGSACHGGACAEQTPICSSGSSDALLCGGCSAHARAAGSSRASSASRSPPCRPPPCPTFDVRRQHKPLLLADLQHSRAGEAGAA